MCRDWRFGTRFGGCLSSRFECIVIPTDVTKDSDFNEAYAVVNNISELPATIAAIV